MTEFTIPAEADKQAYQAMSVVKRALSLVIDDDGAYNGAGTMLSELRAQAKELEAIEKGITKPINDGLNKIRDFFRIPRNRVTAAMQSVEAARCSYRSMVKEQRREAERVAQEAARKERERLEREAAKVEEDARKKREAEEAKARELDEAGKAEKAEAARRASAAKQVISSERAAALRHVADSWPKNPIVYREAPKTKGVHTVTRWAARVTDKSALILAVASGSVPEAALTPDMTFLNKMAVALKGELHYPGIEAYSTETESVRI